VGHDELYVAAAACGFSSRELLAAILALAPPDQRMAAALR
jgi:hypothetical protein